MSELKTFRFLGIDEIWTDSDMGNIYYLKSEADKVIAEKDEEIDELKEHIDELQKATDSAWSKVNVMYDELRHQKYNRCLAMAGRCFTKSNYHFVLARHGEDVKKNNRKSILYSKWRKRWLDIAKKFKEAK